MIAIIIGTKAELIKTIPLMIELRKRRMAYKFIHTGQHNIADLCNEFNIRQPDIVLYKPPKKSSRFMTKTHKGFIWALMLTRKIKKILKQLNPDFVLYHGDTLSTAAAARGSSKNKRWLNGHLEAGLRSGNNKEPFPEEISRKMADRHSDLLFAPSKETAKNLKHLKGKVFVTGNTIVDGIDYTLKIAKKKKLKKISGKYVAVNIHRHENIKSKERLSTIIEIIDTVTYPVYWPMHDNTKKQLKKFGLWKKIQKRNIHITPLIGYVEFLWLLKNCSYIITDGGGIQEESLALKKPCIIMRKLTERQEGLKTGINFLIGTNVRKGRMIIKKLESRNFKILKFKNPYGDGKAAKRIVDILVKK